MATAELALDSYPADGMEVELKVTCGEEKIRTVRTELTDRTMRLPIDLIVRGELNAVHVWTPDNPVLYDVQASILLDGKSPADFAVKTLTPSVSYNEELCAQLGIEVPAN